MISVTRLCNYWWVTNAVDSPDPVVKLFWTYNGFNNKGISTAPKTLESKLSQGTPRQKLILKVLTKSTHG